MNSFLNRIKEIEKSNQNKIYIETHCPINQIKLSINQYNEFIKTIKEIYQNNIEHIYVKFYQIDNLYLIEILSPNKNIRKKECDFLYDEKDYLSLQWIIEEE